MLLYCDKEENLLILNKISNKIFKKNINDLDCREINNIIGFFVIFSALVIISPISYSTGILGKHVAEKTDIYNYWNSSSIHRLAGYIIYNMVWLLFGIIFETISKRMQCFDENKSIHNIYWSVFIYLLVSFMIIIYPVSYLANIIGQHLCLENIINYSYWNSLPKYITLGYVVLFMLWLLIKAVGEVIIIFKNRFKLFNNDYYLEYITPINI
jgi:hypothetical protein